MEGILGGYIMRSSITFTLHHTLIGLPNEEG
jgi:hypothetical protein